MFGRKSLRKSRAVLKSCYSWYKRSGNTLTPPQLTALEHDMEALDQAILNKERDKAAHLAKKLEGFSKEHCKKSLMHYAKEGVIALLIAFLIAVVVRQMWFELYEIPTGSMRPTFKETDHLTVTKTAFGLNVPLKTEHFYFNPDLMQRTSVVIFSGDKLPMRDTETTYFGIIPYTKRYIKRLIGKPGDSLYFYGGKIYGIDAKGEPIQELLDAPWMAHLEHIPFLNFQGEVSQSRDQVLLQQMHQPLARVLMQKYGPPRDEIRVGSQWVKDDLDAAKTSHNTVKTYSDFFGMRNFAMARLVTKGELGEQKNLPDAPLYLELSHTPTPLHTFHSVIPLTEKHLQAIMDNMYTIRFLVKDGRGIRYGGELNKNSPDFTGVPDGTYEFYYGKAYKVHLAGVATELPKEHPLYNIQNVQKLFNFGIEMSTAVAPSPKNLYFPNRYAYFRDGALYLLGAPIFAKDDPTLIAFNEREKSAEMPFQDHGAPLKEGKLDADFIRTFGITVPTGNYLVLGDNHAVSGDSRVFGFVPEANMQGAPSIILWPPGARWGLPEQKPYPLFTLPRLIVWSIALLSFLAWYFWHRRALSQSTFKKT